MASAISSETHRAGDYLEVDPGVAIYYEDEGEGPPLVLVPGWTFTTKVFDHQFAAFSESHRVISFDPRSQGRSTVTLEGNNYATQAGDLSKLLDHLDVENPVLLGWSTGSTATWHYVRDHGTSGLVGHVSVDMPPIGMSCDETDWMEGSIEELAGFYQGVQTAQGLRGVIIWYADNVMIEQEMSPELTAWIVEQSLSTPPLMAASLLADACFGNYQNEAVAVDADIPSLFVVAEHWAEAARPYLAEHCPNSRVEVFGGHMMFWEYPERFNAVLAEFLAGVG
ncbi:MAG: alpha/beta hydrolase [bacterium]|nr:alpha/beta hydrolase [Acidimicrobiia bacterium]MCY4650257.1 alpha/beta hydrolase [bacterium]